MQEKKNRVISKMEGGQSREERGEEGSPQSSGACEGRKADMLTLSCYLKVAALGKKFKKEADGLFKYERVTWTAVVCGLGMV